MEGKQLVRLNLDNSEVKSISPDSISKTASNYDFMATDFYGNIYLTDIYRCTVDKYDIDLNYLTSFGKR